MNEVIMLGRLVQDCQTVVKKDGSEMCTFTLCVRDMDYKNSKGEYDVDFIRCVVFNSSQTELIKKYCPKGSQILVKGKIKTGSYDKDGQTNYTTEVVCSFVEFISTPKGDEDSKKSNKK